MISFVPCAVSHHASTLIVDGSEAGSNTNEWIARYVKRIRKVFKQTAVAV